MGLPFQEQRREYLLLEARQQIRAGRRPSGSQNLSCHMMMPLRPPDGFFSMDNFNRSLSLVDRGAGDHSNRYFSKLKAH